MADTLSITVIIPAYMRQAELLVALESVARQTLLPEQVIVVDDASPVALFIPDELAARLSIRLLRLPSNQGGTHAINVALEYVQTTLVATLDSDDAYAPTYVQEVIAEWARLDAKVALLATSFYWCDRGLLPYRIQRGPSAPITRSLLLQHGNIVGGKSVFSMRTSALRALGGFALTRGADDWLMMLRLLRNYEIRTLVTPLAYYRGPNSNSDNMTRKYRRQAGGLVRVYLEGAGEGGYKAKLYHARMLTKVLLIGGRRRLAMKVSPFGWPGIEMACLWVLGSRNTQRLYAFANSVRARSNRRFPKLGMGEAGLATAPTL